MDFQYHFRDMYNWDTGKSVNLLGHEITDDFMGDFHQHGLGKEFLMIGKVTKTYTWTTRTNNVPATPANPPAPPSGTGR